MSELTTELSAVNEMLRGIGSSPVSTLENIRDVEVAKALSKLRSISRSVQLKGWHFNKEENMKLYPSTADGSINLPQNCLKVDTTGSSRYIDVAQRGLRLYNRTLHSFKFDDPLEVEMVLFLPYEELPEPARNYIMIKAVRSFQDSTLGDDALHVFQEKDEYEALADMKGAEGQTGDYNILRDNIFSITTNDRSL